MRRAIDRRRKEGRRKERDVQSRAEIVKGEKRKERERAQSQLNETSSFLRRELKGDIEGEK